MSLLNRHSGVSSDSFLLSQQIDELLAGALTQEDEDAVLAELEAITQVGVELHVWLLLVQRTVAERECSFLYYTPLHIYTSTLRPGGTAGCS